MLKVRKLGAVLSAAAITFFSLNGSAFAKTRDVRVGTDSNGGPIMLEVDTVTDKSYNLYQSHAGGIAFTTFQPSCSEARLITVRVALYNLKGRLVDEDRSTKEMFFEANSAAATSLRIYCKAYGARGW